MVKGGGVAIYIKDIKDTLKFESLIDTCNPCSSTFTDGISIDLCLILVKMKKSRLVILAVYKSLSADPSWDGNLKDALVRASCKSDHKIYLGDLNDNVIEARNAGQEKL